MEDAEKQLAGKVKFYKMDIDKNPEISKMIESLPTVVFMKDGKVIGQVTGAPPSSKEIVAVTKKVFGLEGK